MTMDSLRRAVRIRQRVRRAHDKVRGLPGLHGAGNVGNARQLRVQQRGAVQREGGCHAARTSRK